MPRSIITPALPSLVLLEVKLRLSGDHETEAPELVNSGHVVGKKIALSLKGETQFSLPGNQKKSA